MLLHSRNGNSRGDGGDPGGRHRRRSRAAILAIAATLVEAVGLWRRGYRMGGNIVARCQQGHLFTTIWLPGASVKSVRLGWWRFQRCPVGGHWSIVTPVRESDLSARERRSARRTKDIRLP